MFCLQKGLLKTTVFIHLYSILYCIIGRLSTDTLDTRGTTYSCIQYSGCPPPYHFIRARPLSYSDFLTNLPPLTHTRAAIPNPSTRHQVELPWTSYLTCLHMLEGCPWFDTANQIYGLFF